MPRGEPNMQNVPVPLTEEERERAVRLKHALLKGLGVPDMDELRRYFSDLSQIEECYVDFGPQMLWNAHWELPPEKAQ